MFIQTESTPNPATLKFLPGQTVLEVGTADFPSAEAAGKSPLASRIFAVKGVEAVFFGNDFVTVTKADALEWDHIKPAILGAVMEHYQSGQPVMDEGQSAASGHAEHAGEDEEIVGQIKQLLDTRVRPAVAQDGGDITFHGFDRGVVYLHMQGACAGCPSSTLTLKMGIENLLRHYIPEVTEVRPVAVFEPTILAFDTSAAHCAAALLSGGRIVAARAEEMARGQAERLMGLLEEVLAESGIGWDGLDALGVGVGPGNFTGIRISVSAARGLALGLGVPVYGIDGFAARRVALGTEGAVGVPAPRDQVYLSRPGAAPELVARPEGLPGEPGPAALAEAIARLAAREWPGEAPAPAPLYLRPADAAPARDLPPVMLDG